MPSKNRSSNIVSTMDRLKALRVLVFCLVTLVIIKMFSRTNTEPPQSSSNMETVKRSQQNDSQSVLNFWKQDTSIYSVDTSEDQLQNSEAHGKEVDFKMEAVEETEDEKMEIIPAPVKPFKGPLRIVHLDLKGAAPKVNYLKQIFPLLSSLGADGVLLEYEDMFPYSGELKILRSPFAYSVAEIDQIRVLANLSNLEIIPLVQVFGHLEFVLKHEKFSHLREVAEFPNSLNPLAPGALDLVEKMLKQVLKRHPEARWFHVGADEVFELGKSDDSREWLAKNNGDLGSLYLTHVMAVCRAVAELRPGIKLLFWDDMIRSFSVSTIQQSGLSVYAYPMIWNYKPNMDVSKIEQLISKYQEAGFTGVWFASAFKGASGVDQRWTPLDTHLQNHLAWLKVIEFVSQNPSIMYHGIALTGWQRYEHFTVLCELFPVAIPSLAVCLQTLKHGAFNEEAENAVHHILGCKIELETSNCDGSGAFAGSEVYHMVKKIHNELQKSIEDIMKNHHLRGALSFYQRKYNFANPRNIGLFKGKLKKLRDDWENTVEDFRGEMEAIFYPDAVEEWMEENVNEQMNKLRSLVKDSEYLFKLNGRPKTLQRVLK